MTIVEIVRVTSSYWALVATPLLFVIRDFSFHKLSISIYTHTHTYYVPSSKIWTLHPQTSILRCEGQMIGKSPSTREKREWSILNDVRFVNQIKDLPYLGMLFDFWYSGPEIKIHCEMFCTMWTPVYVCTRPQFERRKKKMSFSCQMYSFRNTLVLEVELSWAEKKESHQTKLSLFLWLASLNPDLWSSFSVTILDFYGPIRNQTIVPSYIPSAHIYTTPKLLGRVAASEEWNPEVLNTSA